MMQRMLLSMTLLLAAATAFVPQVNNQQQQRFDTSVGIFDKLGEMFQELDNFIDDASARRLGNGAAFYGKRKSSFYGEEDKMRKADSKTPDPTEDYQGPTSSGLFEWRQDENGQMRPVSRMKGKNLERNPAFWDRVYDKEKEE